MNANEDATCQNLGESSKSFQREILNCRFLVKKRDLKSITLTSTLRQRKKQGDPQTQKPRKRKEIIKIRTETNGIEDKKQERKSMKLKVL